MKPSNNICFNNGHKSNKEVRDGGGRNTPPGSTPPPKPSYSTPKPNH